MTFSDDNKAHTRPCQLCCEGDAGALFLFLEVCNAILGTLEGSQGEDNINHRTRLFNLKLVF